MLKHWTFLVVSTLYLLNFTLGVWELPDNLPVVGNLDEFAASSLWIYSAKAIRARRQTKKIEEKGNPAEAARN